MKIKIALLSSTVLCLILAILGSFIYFTVYNRVVQLQNNELSSQAQAIAQYYSSHSNGGTLDEASVRRWLHQNVHRDQEAIVLGPDHHVIEQAGDLNSGEILPMFQPTQALIQQTVALKGQKSVIFTETPVTNEESNQTIGYVVLASDISYIQEYMENLFAVLIAGGVGAVILAGVGGYFIAAAGLKPIYQLIRIVERIEANRMNERVEPVKGRDEVARLTLTFNHMLSRIERSFDQQMRFVADASHEIRTPLTTILGYANLLDRWGKTDAAVLDKSIRVIRKESLRLQHLANDLLVLAGMEAERSEPAGNAYLDEMVEEVVEEQCVLYPLTEVNKQLAVPVKVLMTPNHLKQVVTNVLSNGLKYTSAGGTVEVRTWREGKAAVFQVADTGCGIPQADLPHVFERFYRADRSRERLHGGNGLGLSIVRELVESYKGDIGIESKEDEGTTVTIRLPLEV